MSLKKQKLQLLADYRTYGKEAIPESVVVEVLIPLLEIVAQTLKLEQVYFWANPSREIMCIFSLQNPQNPADVRRTTYFFASEQDAKRHPHYDKTKHRIDKLPILLALFHLLSCVGEMDQAIFYHQKGRMKESKVFNLQEFVRQFNHHREAVNLTAPLAKSPPFGLA